MIRSVAVLGLGVLILAGVGGCATSKPTLKASDSAVVSIDGPITSPTATLVVHGMSCLLCASNVDKQLLDVPGVSGVNVNMNTGHVAITIDPKQPPTRDMLARAIDRSGFTLAEVRTP